VFISVVSTNPATLLGFGTWAAFGAGRVLVGIDAGQSEFDTVEETGGAKTHTLAESEIPGHTHSYTQPDAPAMAVLAGVSAAVTGVTAGVATGSTGGDGAHNNLQPYIVVYMWKRTA
jgi:microcystin-dependent protein